MVDEEQENLLIAYCEAIDDNIPLNHVFFKYWSEMKLAQAMLGLAVSEGGRLQETREIMDMHDTLFGNLIDSESKLPDMQRKKLNHADEVWLDLKEKLSEGSRRTAYLYSAHSHMRLALAYLVELKGDQKFEGRISDYLLNYLDKLSIFTYREAIGHVML